jgi:hypothetical protein
MQSDRLSMKLLRLALFILFAQTVVTLILARAVHAEVQNLLMSSGAQMMQLGKELGAATPRTLRLNGAQMRLRVQSSSTYTLPEVLDEFEARCREHNGRFYEQLRSAPKTRSWNEAQLSIFDGVMRVEQDDGGAVACMDVGDERGSADTLLARAQRFVVSGDAAAFGELRYMRAERTERGVFVVMMWTDGAFNIRNMFPTSGDAPGVDFPGLPRPDGSRRVLSAWEEGQAPAFNIYDSPGAKPSELDARYRQELPKHRWEVVTPPNGSVGTSTHGLLAMRDGVTVTLSQVQVNGRSMTAIVPMDTRGATSVTAGR